MFVSPWDSSEKVIFFFIWMWFSTGNSFWVRSEGMIPLLSFLGPHLVQSCKLYEWCHSLCEFICSSALLCLEGLDSFQFSTHIWFLQLFLFHRTPWTRGKRPYRGIQCLLVLQILSLSDSCQVVGLCIFFPSVRERASVVMAKHDTDLSKAECHNLLV